MTSALAIVLLGFFLGMRHASDPDHVVAVTTIVRRERAVSQAVMIGAFWGLGHTITILIVGSALILFKLTIPPRLGLSMELSVALMLILLGIMTITGVTQHAVEWITMQTWGNRTHSHVGHKYLLVHSHASKSFPGLGPKANAPAPGRSALGWFHVLRPLVVGVVHGLAGSAAVALLVLATINSPLWAICFLLVFGLGTVAGMMLVTGAIAVPFAYTLQRFALLHRSLSLASGLISLSFGLFLFYQIAIVDRLFASRPNWIPH